MDGVVVLFAKASVAQVQAYASLMDGQESVSRDSATFFVRPYTGWLSELDEDERAQVEHRLGSLPVSSFSIEARHGASARFALEWLASWPPEMGMFVVDDDFGHLWSLEDIQRGLNTAEDYDLYSLRTEG